MTWLINTNPCQNGKKMGVVNFSLQATPTRKLPGHF